MVTIVSERSCEQTDRRDRHELDATRQHRSSTAETNEARLSATASSFQLASNHRRRIQLRASLCHRSRRFVLTVGHAALYTQHTAYALTLNHSRLFRTFTDVIKNVKTRCFLERALGINIIFRSRSVVNTHKC